MAPAETTGTVNAISTEGKGSEVCPGAYEGKKEIPACVQGDIPAGIRLSDDACSVTSFVASALGPAYAGQAGLAAGATRRQAHCN